MDVETLRTPRGGWARGLVPVGLLLLVGCGDGRAPDRGPPAPDRSPAEWAALAPDDFCRQTGAAVEAFLGTPTRVAPGAREYAERHGADAMGRAPGRSGDRYGGTAVVGSHQELRDGLNGLFGTHYRSVQHQLHVGLMPLLRRGPSGGIEPWLAESWALADDGMSLTFVLRDDVVWHDGVPVTADDLVFTFLRAVDPDVAAPAIDVFRDYLSGPGDPPTVDGRSVTFRLRPHPASLDPWLLFPVLPAHLLGEVPPAELRAHPYGTRCPVGNGPFVFVEHLQDERWTFRANPTFPADLGGRPYLDGYVYRVVPEASTLLTELLTAGVDLVPRLSLDQVGPVDADPEVEVLSTPGTSYVYVAWNTRRPVLADPAVRRALTLGMDRPGILAGIRGGRGVLAATGIPPSHGGWVAPDPASQTFDADAASRLLDGAGWTAGADGVRRNRSGDPLRFTLLHDAASREQGDIAQRIQSTLGDLGVQVEVRSLEFGTLLARAESAQRDFDALIMSSQPGERIDETSVFHSRDRDDGPYAWSGVADPELDRLLEELSRSGEPESVPELWARYQERLVELQPYTWLYLPDWLTGVRERLQGVRVDVRGEWAGITDWWVDGASGR